MKIEDCKTVPEFFGVGIGESIWVDGTEFIIGYGRLAGALQPCVEEGRALVGCLTGQLKWSKTKPSDDEKFGSCVGCGYEFNSELISEYEIKYCPKCGQKIEETTEEIIVPAMTEEEENLLREIAAWFSDWNLLYLNKTGSITYGRHNGCWAVPFGVVDNGSKAYEALAPILDKYGEINLDDYR